eukprot:4987990-Lingulodinium_polyedra.AAC.1
MQEDWIENAPGRLQEVMSPRSRDGEESREEVRQRTITVAMGNGIHAMQVTERIKVTDNMTALQTTAEQQRLRSS